MNSLQSWVFKLSTTHMRDATSTCITTDAATTVSFSSRMGASASIDEPVEAFRGGEHLIASLTPNEADALLPELYRRLAKADPVSAHAACEGVVEARRRQSSLNRSLLGDMWLIEDSERRPIGMAHFGDGSSGSLRLLALSIAGTYLASRSESSCADHCVELRFPTRHRYGGADFGGTLSVWVEPRHDNPLLAGSVRGAFRSEEPELANNLNGLTLLRADATGSDDARWALISDPATAAPTDAARLAIRHAAAVGAPVSMSLAAVLPPFPAAGSGMTIHRSKADL